MVEERSRQYLFISYASEDGDLAEWLTLKLTSEGYAVWCDRFKLLGGESYPRNIDEAIKSETFRVIALLSRFSLSKPNPVKERTLALNIARSRKEDFLIPLNVDGLRPTELDWMTSDLTFIPFYKSWALGLRKLLKKLSSIDAPKPIRNGKETVAATFLDTGFTDDQPEEVSTNCLRILRIPDVIKKFRFNTYVSRYALLTLADTWAIYPKDGGTAFAFHSPPEDHRVNYQITYEKEYALSKTATIEGIDSGNIVKNLLSRSIHAELSRRGLVADRNKLHFPPGLLDGNRIRFRGYSGRYTRVQVSGRRIWRRVEQEPEEFQYCLSPRFRVRQDLDYGYIAQLTIGLRLTDMSGEPLKRKSAFARGRRIRKNWWNHEWYNRSLAIVSYLAGDKDTIVLGENEREQIVISAEFIKGEVPVRVVEEKTSEHEEPIEDEIELVVDEWDDEELEEVSVIQKEIDDLDES